jgi:hypothetical protein
MKQIQPISIWSNGTSQSANFINAYIINDNLINSATFYYSLLASTTDGDGNVSSTQLSQGNLTMDGTDYENWGEASDINQEAYVWITTQLNLTLV